MDKTHILPVELYYSENSPSLVKLSNANMCAYILFCNMFTATRTEWASPIKNVPVMKLSWWTTVHC